MIFIYKDLIKKYISYLTPNHIKRYALSKNIYLTNEEINIIYNFIINNYNDLLEDNNAIYKLKPYLNDKLFEQVLKEYIENKTKYL